MIVDKITKTFAMNLQMEDNKFLYQKFGNTVEVTVPEECKTQDEEGKMKFLDFSDKVFNVAKALTERDRLQAIKKQSEN